jgi:hypothetical protein
LVGGGGISSEEMRTRAEAKEEDRVAGNGGIRGEFFHNE